MDKLKKILSPSHKDDTVSGQGEPETAGVSQSQSTGTTGGLSGQGSHLASAKDSETTPIYDQFTNKPPTSSSNDPSLAQGTTGGLQPQSASRPGVSDEASTIGVKDGVMGQPHQGSTTLPHRGATGQQSGSTGEGLTGDRAFPLAGGVAGGQGLSSGTGNREGLSSTNEPGQGLTSDTQGGLGQQGLGQGQQGLSQSQDPSSQHHLGRDAGLGAAGAGGLYEAEKHHHNRNDPTSQGLSGQGLSSSTQSGQGNTGLSSMTQGQQGATGAQETHGWPEHEHHGHGHHFHGDPCEHESHNDDGPHFVPGPHGVDTANRLDPHVHVPGSYPDATPTEERGQPGYGRDAGLAGGVGAGALGGRHEHDRNRQEPGSQHHLGRDAGLGAAGAGGLYEAEKHHHNKHDPTSQGQTGLGQGQTGLGQGQQGLGQGQPGLGQGQQGLSQSQDPSSQHHYGRDAGLGAAGAGGLYEAEKHHHNKHDPTSQGQTGLGQGQTGLGQGQQGLGQGQPGLGQGQQGLGQTQDPSSQHHYGRDAGLGAAGAGGLYEAEKHHHNKHDPTSHGQTGLGQGQQGLGQGQQGLGQTQDPTSQHHYGRDAGLGAAGAGGLYEAEKHHHNKHDPTTQGQQGLSQGQDPTSQQGQHHYGRDAALGTAGAGGVYEAEKHHREKEHLPKEEKHHHHDKESKHHKEKEYKEPKEHHYGRDAGLAGAGAAGAGGLYEEEHRRGDTGPASKTLGPHDSNVANVLDPRVKPEPEKMKDRTTEGPHKSNLLNKLDPRVKDSSKAQDTQQGDDQHHYGRDAGLAGGAGAAGLGAYEAEKHHNKDQRYDPNTTSGAGVQDPNNPQQHGLRHTGELGASQQHTGPQDTQGQHHYGRDAALAGGAGAAAYEADKKHQGREHEQNQIRRDDPSAFGGAALSSSNEPSMGNMGASSPDGSRSSTAQRAIEQHRQAAASAQQPYESAVRDGPTGSNQGESGHHYGRDAALAGGAAGAGGLGAHEYEKHHGQHGNQQLGMGEQRYDPSNTSSQDPSQQHHYGRDAGLAGGAGAAGLGAHEASKHHREHESRDPTSQGYNDPNTRDQTSHSHKGRDAAAIGGAGLGAHELSKHEEKKLEREQASGLHNTRNDTNVLDPMTHSNVPGQTQGQSQHHYGRDAALAGGAAGVGEHEHRKHEGNEGHLGQPQHHYNQDGVLVPGSDREGQGQSQHHYGRDAAAVGAGGVGAHELSKHEKEKKLEREQESGLHNTRDDTNVLDPMTHSNIPGQTTGQGQSQHHYGRDAAVAGGAAGVGEHEHRKHEHEHEEPKEEKKSGGLFGFLKRGSKDKDSESSSPTEARHSHDHHSHDHKREAEYGAGAAGLGAADYEAEKEGRNRLHKDPPAGYVEKQQQLLQEQGGDQMHPGYGNEQGQGQSGVVTEPHTGLPMNVGKYGDGHGGTDGNQAISGASGHQGTQEHQANWDQIRKANTPY